MLGVENVPLDFDQGRRERGQAAVDVRERVARILPALVAEPGVHDARVLDEAVPVDVSKAVDPIQGGQRVGQQLGQEVDVAGPAHELGEQDQKQRRGVDAAVVGGVGNQLQVRKLPVAHLVQDLPGLLVLEVVDLRPLHRRQRVQRAAGELGPH